MEKLHRLIKSLSKAEKRAFRARAIQNGTETSDYLLIFNAINKMDEYDERLITAPNGKDCQIKSLAVKKTKLYEQILEVIRHLKRNASVEIRIKNLILDARHLQERHLYDDSEALLRKAKKLAEHYFLHLALLEINHEHRTLIKRKQGALDKLQKLIQEDKGLIHTFQETRSYIHSFDEITFTGARRKAISSKEQKEVVEKYRSFLDRPASHLAERSRFWYFQSKAFFHYLNNELLDFYKQSKRAIEWWDQYPDIRKQELEKYIGTVINLLNQANRLKKTAEIDKMLARIDPEPPVTGEDFFIASSLARFKLFYYINIGEWKKLTRIISRIEEDMEEYPIGPLGVANLTYNMAAYFFIIEDFTKASIYLQKLLEMKKKKQLPKALEKSGSLLLLISIYEEPDLEDKFNMERLYRQVKRFFRAYPIRQKAYEFQTLQLLSELNRAPLERQKALLVNFQRYLLPFSKQDKYMLSTGFEEIFLWASSRVQKTPITNLMDKKRTNSQN